MFNEFKKSKVVPFNQYFPNIESMNPEQLKFYNYWKGNILKGKYIDLEGNISYAFVFIYAILSIKDPQKRLDGLLDFLNTYQGKDIVPNYCKNWISDTFICIGDIKKALDWYEIISINARASFPTDRLLSLKYLLGKDISGRDVLTLLGPKVTKFAKENLIDIENYLNIAIEAEKVNENKNFIKDWVSRIEKNNFGYPIYSGTVYSNHISSIDQYDFSRSEIVVSFIKELTREAENSFREERSVPRVGEGWIAETNLFYEIKKAFPKNKVIHHARPEWLGRQHLDILIEDLSIAIEYQGLQHDKPIDFFGGEEAFLSNQKRDKRKKNLCKRNNIRLIYVREQYSLPQLIEEINNQKHTN
jgi:hypothetical protein